MTFFTRISLGYCVGFKSKIFVWKPKSQSTTTKMSKRITWRCCIQLQLFIYEMHLMWAFPGKMLAIYVLNISWDFTCVCVREFPKCSEINLVQEYATCKLCVWLNGSWQYVHRAHTFAFYNTFAMYPAPTDEPTIRDGEHYILDVLNSFYFHTIPLYALYLAPQRPIVTAMLVSLSLTRTFFSISHSR